MSESIKDMSGKRSYTSLADMLISVNGAEAKVVLLVSKPKRTSCCSTDDSLVTLLPGVLGDLGVAFAVGSVPPNSTSSESIQVVLLMISFSFSESCSMEVSCFSACVE